MEQANPNRKYKIKNFNEYNSSNADMTSDNVYDRERYYNSSEYLDVMRPEPELLKKRLYEISLAFESNQGQLLLLHNQLIIIANERARIVKLLQSY